MNEPKTSGTIAYYLITEFFHEVLSHVMPGCVFLSLYFYTYLMRASALLNNSSTLLCFSILISAWLIGITIDMSVYVTMMFFLRLLKCPIYRKTIHEFREHWNSFKKDRPIDQQFSQVLLKIHVLFHIGEKVMFRCLATISFFTIFFQPKLFLHLFGNENYDLIGRCVSGIFFLIYFFIWIWFEINVFNPRNQISH
jgi:hypothetical protein